MQPRSTARTASHRKTVSRRTRALVAALALTTAWPAAAQPAAETPPPALSTAGNEAAALFAGGDLAAAIAKLEAVPEASWSAVDRSLLGALYYEAGRFDDAWRALGPLAERQDADAAVLYQAGRTALALGQPRRAATLLERSVRLVPRSPAARELGLLLGQIHEYERALSLLMPWSLANPDDLVAVRAAAASAVRVGRLRDAELLLRRVPEDDPGGSVLRAQLFLFTGKPREAVELLAKMLDDHPPELDLDLRRLLADGYIQTGQSAEAIPLVEPCSDHEPRCALLLAEARYRGGDIVAAIAGLEQHAQKALRDAAELPDDLRARLAQMQGRLLVAAARYDEALPYLELAGQLLPDEPLSWKSLGDSLAALGRREEALAAMERFRTTSEAANERRRALDLARQNPTGAAIEEAEKRFAAGESEAALAIIRREIALDPDNLPVRLTETHMLLRLGRLDQALAAAEAVVDSFPTDADARYTRAAVRMARRELDLAEADFAATLELAPGHVAALNDFAVLLMTSGRRQEARPLLERALTLSPDDELAARHLESLRDDAPR